MPDMKDCPPYIKEYIFYMRVVKNRSEKTIESYYLDLRLFLRYIKENFMKASDPDTIADVPFERISSITLADVYEYLNYSADERGNNEKTRARKISALKSFYRAVAGNKLTSYHIDKNPLLNLDVPSPKKAQPKYLDLDSSKKLLESVDMESDSYERDFCILMMFLNCGMRLAELVGINLQDIDLDDRTLRLLGKGNKERIVHINEGVAQAIINYMGVRPDGETDAFFLSKRKTRISRRRVQQIVENGIKKIGLANHGLSTHKLRHTAATLMYQYGNVDPMVLKEILGHASVSTTEIYTHLTNENVRVAMESNPLAVEGVKKSHSKNK